MSKTIFKARNQKRKNNEDDGLNHFGEGEMFNSNTKKSVIVDSDFVIIFLVFALQTGFRVVCIYKLETFFSKFSSFKLKHTVF